MTSFASTKLTCWRQKSNLQLIYQWNWTARERAQISDNSQAIPTRPFPFESPNHVVGAVKPYKTSPIVGYRVNRCRSIWRSLMHHSAASNLLGDAGLSATNAMTLALKRPEWRTVATASPLCFQRWRWQWWWSCVCRMMRAYIGRPTVTEDRFPLMHACIM